MILDRNENKDVAILLGAGSMGMAIPGSANKRHIQENLDILDFELSMDEMSKLNALESRRFYQFSDRQAEAMFTSWRPDFEGQKKTKGVQTWKQKNWALA